MPDDGKTVILIAYDGTHAAKRAVHYAGKFLSADRAVLLTVWRPPQPGLDEAQRTNEEGMRLALAAGLPAEPRCLPETGTVWDTIIETADTLDADLIVTGTRGITGPRALVETSVADRVLRHGGRPVLIVPPER